jgi:hypothetical protein
MEFSFWLVHLSAKKILSSITEWSGRLSYFFASCNFSYAYTERSLRKENTLQVDLFKSSTVCSVLGFMMDFRPGTEASFCSFRVPWYKPLHASTAKFSTLSQWGTGSFIMAGKFTPGIPLFIKYRWQLSSSHLTLQERRMVRTFLIISFDPVITLAGSISLTS